MVNALRALGWNIASVYDSNVSIAGERRDWVVLAWARSQQMVLLTLDKMRHKGVGIRMQEEIRDNGGKLLTISGGPEQHLTRAVGRLLAHAVEWERRLTHSDGWFQIKDHRDAGFTWKSREQLAWGAREIREPHFYEYEAIRSASRPRRRKPALPKMPAEQGNLDQLSR